MVSIIFTVTEKELLKVLGLDRDKLWEYVSLDDWDYALIVEGNMSKNRLNRLDRLLTGCCDNLWVYIPESNKTIGMAYHA